MNFSLQFLFFLFARSALILSLHMCDATERPPFLGTAPHEELISKSSHHTLRGPRGHRGHKGHKGSRGRQGVQGPPGEAFSASYLSVYSVNDLSIPPGQALSFSASAASSNDILFIENNTFCFTQGGVYQVRFGVATAEALPIGQITLILNGNAVEGGALYIDIEEGYIGHMCMLPRLITVSPQDRIQVLWHPNDSISHLDLSTVGTTVRAFLLITRVA